MSICAKQTKSTLILLIGTVALAFGAAAMAAEKAPRAETAFERDTANNAQPISWEGLHPVHSFVLPDARSTSATAEHDQRMTAGLGVHKGR